MANEAEEHRRHFNQARLAEWHEQARLTLDGQLRFSILFLTSIILLSGGGLTAIVALKSNSLTSGAGAFPLPEGLTSIYILFVAATLNSLACAGLAYLFSLADALSMNADYDQNGFFKRADKKWVSSIAVGLHVLSLVAGLAAVTCLGVALIQSIAIVS